MYGAYDAFLAPYGESTQEALAHIVDRAPGTTGLTGD